MDKIDNTTVPNSDVVYVLKVIKAIEKSLQTGTVQAIEQYWQLALKLDFNYIKNSAPYINKNNKESNTAFLNSY